MSDELKVALEEWFEAKRIEQEQMLIDYPPDVPNEKGIMHLFKA